MVCLDIIVIWKCISDFTELVSSSFFTGQTIHIITWVSPAASSSSDGPDATVPSYPLDAHAYIGEYSTTLFGLTFYICANMSRW